ncbi:MAG TPA: dihydrofolate reductase family protein [Trueperaceae bacterium]
MRYQVACSLDGFIAGPEGEYDWIPEEPDFDFAALFGQFDTLLVGRKTYEAVPGMVGDFPGKEIVIFSTTLRKNDHPGVTIVGADLAGYLAELRSRPGRDIWLFGGGELFRTLLKMGQVDTVEPAVMPVLLGRGLRLLPEAPGPWRLALKGQRSYPKSGMVYLEYYVVY